MDKEKRYRCDTRRGMCPIVGWAQSQYCPTCAQYRDENGEMTPEAAEIQAEYDRKQAARQKPEVSHG